MKEENEEQQEQQETQEGQEFTHTALFELKGILEQQIERDFVESDNAKSDGAFEFLIGEWNLIRTSFDAGGNVASRTSGVVEARYVFDGRAIQEDFYNFHADGSAYRAGTALYTYAPSTQQWHVAAIDASTGATSYQPVWQDGEVHYDSVVQLPDRKVYTKSRIYNIASDTTEWAQEVSVDGVTWYPNYHICNIRRGAPEQGIEAKLKLLLEHLYPDFNARDIERILPHFMATADWPNGMTGGREVGHDAIAAYWQHQWTVINSQVTPISFRVIGGYYVLEVHQLVKDMAGETLSDSVVYHTYKFDNDKIERMDISDDVPGFAQSVTASPVAGYGDRGSDG